MGSGRCVVAVGAGCEYMGDTYMGSGFVSTAGDMLKMSAVRWVRCVGGVCVFRSSRDRMCGRE